MKYLSLIRAGLFRRPLRSLLTVLAIAVAFLLFGMLHGVVSSFDRALDRMSDVRLRVLSRANILETLPIAYQQRLQQIEGVTHAVPVTIFLGYYQSPINGITGAGIDLEGFLDVIPEVNVPEEQRRALLANRMGAAAGVVLAERHGWKIGDRIPVKSVMWMNEETGQDWVFELEAIVNGGPDDDRAYAQELWFHYEYLDQGRTTGKGRVNQFVLGISDQRDGQRIAAEVDALFANSSDETVTLDEKQYVQSNIRRIGDVESFVYYILSAVLFTLLFMTGTNMLQSIRERTSELGIMRALGFQGSGLGLLVVAESTVLCVTGAALGMAIAGIIFPDLFASFGIEGIHLAARVYLQGLAISVILALVVSAWPAWRTASLDVVEAIAGERRR